jgi:hypothetical protein
MAKRIWQILSSPLSRCFLVILCLLGSIVVMSCRASEDSAAAAKQLATTSADLGDYYSAMAQIVTADIALGDLQNSLLPHADILPFPESNRALLNTTSSELQKRADLAKALQGLSNAFSNLNGSTAPTDAANAASTLGTELTTLKALPQSSGAPLAVLHYLCPPQSVTQAN